MQCPSPREFDPTSSSSLRFFYVTILFTNFLSLWAHATQGAPEGRAIILDFIGLAYVPSKVQLLGLDVLIIGLQMILAMIAYEVSYNDARKNANSDTQDDLLLPIPDSPQTPLLTPLFSQPDTPLLPTSSSHAKSYFAEDESSYVIDLTFSAVIERLRRPPPPLPTSDNALPLPTTTPWPLPVGMRMLMRARGRSLASNRPQAESTVTLPGTLRP